jgi:WD repeat-containing protein 61
VFEVTRKIATEQTSGVWCVAALSSSSVVSGGGESLKVWSLDSGATERVVAHAHRAAITGIATNRNRTLLASTALDGHVKLWSTAAGSGDAPLKDVHVGPVESWQVAFEPTDDDAAPVDSLRLATTCQSGAASVNLWALQSGEKSAAYGTPATSNATTVALAFSGDGRLLASAAMDGSVSLFEARSGVKRHTFAAHAMPVRALCFSADSSTLLTGSDDAQIRVHDVESCSPILSLSGHSSWVLALAASPDRKRFASGSADKTVRVWDTGNRQSSSLPPSTLLIALTVWFLSQRKACTRSASTPTKCGRSRGRPTQCVWFLAPMTQRCACTRHHCKRTPNKQTMSSSRAAQRVLMNQLRGTTLLHTHTHLLHPTTPHTQTHNKTL